VNTNSNASFGDESFEAMDCTSNLCRHWHTACMPRKKVYWWVSIAGFHQLL